MTASPPLAISKTLMNVAIIVVLTAAMMTMGGCSTSRITPASNSTLGTQDYQPTEPELPRRGGRVGGAVRGGQLTPPQPLEIEPPQPFTVCCPRTR
jgi:hypothetical protein